MIANRDYERIKQLIKRHANSDEVERLLEYLKTIERDSLIIDALRDDMPADVYEIYDDIEVNDTDDTDA